MTIRTISTCVTGVAALVLLGAAPASAAPARVPVFHNCTALHRTYPHGVGRVGAHDHVRGHTAPVTNFYRSNAIYAANASLDRDHDHVACESH